MVKLSHNQYLICKIMQKLIIKLSKIITQENIVWLCLCFIMFLHHFVAFYYEINNFQFVYILLFIDKCDYFQQLKKNY